MIVGLATIVLSGDAAELGEELSAGGRAIQLLVGVVVPSQTRAMRADVGETHRLVHAHLSLNLEVPLRDHGRQVRWENRDHAHACRRRQVEVGEVAAGQRSRCIGGDELGLGASWIGWRWAYYLARKRTR